ncbi:MAG: hypothetical protein LBC73_07455 [Oscillospiraceae bacterium]|nr:hypothetical protein [Oscillospiraceae bacterium]
MNNTSIINNIISLLRNKFLIYDELLIIENWDEPLTGDIFMLTAIDLAYLLFELEKIYEIRVLEKQLISHGFYSISEIYKTIESSLCIEYNNE